MLGDTAIARTYPARRVEDEQEAVRLVQRSVDDRVQPFPKSGPGTVQSGCVEQDDLGLLLILPDGQDPRVGNLVV